MAVKRGIDKATAMVVDRIKELAQTVEVGVAEEVCVVMLFSQAFGL
jgi:hypothetical protein